jgi:hypothetical protein
LSSLFDNFPLKFSKSAKDMKDQFSSAGCGIDVLGQALKAYPPFVKGSDGVDEVSQRPAQPIQPPDNEGVALSEVAESLSESLPLSNAS